MCGGAASLADYATVAVAGIAATVGGYEYLRAGRWKAAELASSYLRRLSEDEELQFACKALDWGVGPAKVPQKYIGIVGAQQIEHKPETLEYAVDWKLNLETAISSRGLLYRWVFDTFFSYLSEAQTMIDLKLVRRHHLFDLRYWLERIAAYHYAEENRSDEVFASFIVVNGYGQVLRLFDSLNVKFQISDQLVARLRPEINGDLRVIAQRLKKETAENVRLKSERWRRWFQCR